MVDKSVSDTHPGGAVQNAREALARRDRGYAVVGLVAHLRAVLEAYDAIGRALDMAGEQVCAGSDYARHVTELAADLAVARETGAAESRAVEDAMDVALRVRYATTLGILDPEDSPPCWDDIVDGARLDGAKAMQEAAAEVLGDHDHEDPADCLFCRLTADIRGLDPAAVLVTPNPEPSR